ncbi:MAG: GTPase Era [Betaproteobacteria bacterium]|jgi:GTP-binding protein Era|nr:MAG: GTPase Era [Betaproteobacteria bacterium]
MAKLREAQSHRSGTVVIVGRPNVGKSTLLNRLIGVKLSIVSRRAQTTRHRILGIYTASHAQIAFLDTPGFQLQHASALNRAMNRTVTTALRDVDAVVLVVEAGVLTDQDKEIIAMLSQAVPVLAVVNKIDKLKDPALLLPIIDELQHAYPFAEIVPISAEKGRGIPDLVETVIKYLPIGEPVYDAEAITDRPEKFLAAEIVREKLFQSLGQELPYGTTVEIERFDHEGPLRRVHATVIVSKAAHKAMVIGARGAKLKSIATRARKDMERLFGGQVFLEIWVRVKQGWSDDARSLRMLGY